MRACGARPSAGWPRDRDKAFRGQTRGRREGRFSRRDALCASALQGRTRAEAFHFHRMRAREAGALMGKILLEANAVIVGVQRPPLREMAKGSGQGLPGANRGTARRAVFSEGRALRVRVVRPSECGGISFPPDDEAKGPWPKGDMPRSSPCHLLRACRARPSAGLVTGAGMA